jgi:tetratricopeptide (TPR) repeat protein
LKTAIRLAEKLNGAKTIMAGLWGDLGLLYVSQKRYSESESCYKKSLEIRQASLGEDHPATASTLCNLAEVYRREGKSQLAEEYFKRAIAAMEKNPPDNKILLSATYRAYARLLRTCGRTADALKMEAKARN